MTSNTELPDYLSENDDGSLRITMRGGAALTMREPTVADQLAAKGEGRHAEISLAGNLLGLAPDEMAAMTSRNYLRVQAGLKHFFG